MPRLQFIPVCIALGLAVVSGVASARPKPQGPTGSQEGAKPSTASAAQASYDTAFARYKNGRYVEAAKDLRALLAVDASDDEARAKVYLKARPTYVACLDGIAEITSDLNQKKALLDEAEAVILAQYRQEPFYTLPTGYSPTVSTMWNQVYTKNYAELEALRDQRLEERIQAADLAAKKEKLMADRVQKLEAMAENEIFTETRSRVVASIPFGVGQFQNDERGWGLFFALTETFFVSSAVVSWGIAEAITGTKCPDTRIDDDTGELRPVDCDELLRNFDIARGVNYASIGLAGAFMIGGIIQAQAVFTPERTVTRKRKLPPPVTMAPTAFVTPEGGYFGVVGTF